MTAHRILGRDGEHQAVVKPSGAVLVEIAAMAAGKLAKGASAGETITCTDANTDYDAAGAMPAGTKYVTALGSAAFKIAMGEATSATIGIPQGGSVSATYPVTVTGTAADDTVHVQSPTAGATVTLGYGKD